MNEDVRLKAEELSLGAGSSQEISERIVWFVRDKIPYYLDEWDVEAGEVLSKMQGMCAGKAMLAAELHRAVGIPARFKVVKILAEEGLFAFLARRLEEKICFETSTEETNQVLRSIYSLPPERDHILLQVFLDDQWKELDLARDTNLDYGMLLVGIWRKRKITSEEDSHDSLGDWLDNRMQRRAVTDGRQAFFQVVNNQLEQLRQIGRIGRKAGLCAWSDAELRESLSNWDIISDCPTSEHITRGVQLNELAKNSRALLLASEGPAKIRLERELVDWLYSLTRRNVKRGRFWELPDVLTHRRADCLGYARVLRFLSNEFGLDGGVVEVVQDNSGRFVPHSVCLVNLSDGQKRFIDPWYGSADIRHRLIVVRVKGLRNLVTKQLAIEALESDLKIYGLSPDQLVGLSFYIMGNSYLVRGMDADALDCYNASLWLYPGNSRTMFNRAVALERLNEKEQARAGYQHAFSIDPSLASILSSTEDIEPLIMLDEKGVSDTDQEVYLLRSGFVTGHKEEWSKIDLRCGITSAEARSRYRSVLAMIGQ